LVHWILKKRFRWAVKGRIEYDDLFQAGCFGLMRAAKKFEPERGLRFSTYAMGWVTAFVWKYIKDNHRLVRVPVGALDKKRALPERITYLDAPLPSGTATRHEVTGAEDRDYERDAAREDVNMLLQHLPPRLRRVARLRMSDHTFEEIADEFGVTRERVRQLKREAVHLLKVRSMGR